MQKTEKEYETYSSFPDLQQSDLVTAQNVFDLLPSLKWRIYREGSRGGWDDSSKRVCCHRVESTELTYQS
jgi:hypothetical protein